MKNARLARRETPLPNPDAAADTLLKLTATLVAELHPTRQTPGLTLDSSLERDLGLDSLARVELLMRVERAFGVKLSEDVLGSAETPRDLLRAVLAGHPVSLPQGRAVRLEAPEAALAVPDQAATLQEALAWHVRAHPGRVHIVCQSSEGEDQEIAYGRLHESARAVAAGLARRGVQPGQTVALMLPTGPEYFYCFFGVLLAGAVPVPIYPPARLAQIEDHFRRHAGILSNAGAVMLITVPQAKALARLLTARVDSLESVATPEDLAGEGGPATVHTAKSEDIAFLQYTSGSTGNPKGVILTHANLLANLRAMGQAAQVDSRDAFVSWLPLYHDMGLIGAWLGSLYYAYPLVVMSPLAFLARPERWLWAIHRHRGTLSAAPNFAYELCLRKIEDRDIEGLDLSSWRWAFNGAEPVSAHTMREFARRFGRYGLDPGAIAPVFGLAECSVGLAFPPPGRGLLVDRIRRDALLTRGRAVPAGPDESAVLEVVACGRPLPGHQVRVVDAAGGELGEREEGHLQFKGPSATQGYFRNPEQTRALIRGEWLDTGDLAYLAGGDIFITGRSKDVIIRGGRNLYPYELEEAVGDIPGIRRGCVAVFGSPDPVSGTERVVVMAETREADPEKRKHLVQEINGIAVDILGMPPDDIVLAPPHTVLKTSSGKIRRAASRELYEKGLVGAGNRAVWLQVARLAWDGVKPQLRRGLRAAAGLGYAAYASLVFWLLAPATWLCVALLRRTDWAWAVGSAAARLLLRLTGTRLTVEGIENLPKDGPCVLVANHASYLDGPTVFATLPRPLSFVVKRELLDSLVSRVFLTRIGCQFVERFHAPQGAADTERLTALVQAGHSLVFFPEGTFTRVPGLRPFHLGAFVVAARTGVPVVPVILKGTRSILRDKLWLPRRGAIHVRIEQPIQPQGRDWQAAVRLRDAVREMVLRHCGEPDLAVTA